MKTEDLPVVSAKNGETLHIAQEAVRTFDPDEQADQSDISLHDILFILFRHKWKIIFFGLAGILAAGGVYLLVPPVYESQAKLLVRYVMDRSAVDGLDVQIKAPTPENHAVINSELQILTSSDLMRQVAELVGINRLLRADESSSDLIRRIAVYLGIKRLAPGLETKTAIDKAVEFIYRNLEVSVVIDTNIISVSFRSNDPTLPTPLVQELVKRYFDKHLEVHRSTGAFDFVTRETADLKKELSQTELELKKLKESAGIISLAETQNELAAEFGKTELELDTAEAELAAQRVRVVDIERSSGIADAQRSGHTALAPVPSSEVVSEYQALLTEVAHLRETEMDLLSKYTAQNPAVKIKKSQIEDLQKQRSYLEKQYPALLETVSDETASGIERIARRNLASERAVLAGMESKVKALRTRMSNVQARVKAISEVTPRIEELQRKAEVEEVNYKHSEASLEKARIDETLDPSRMPNISIVQTPSRAIELNRGVARIVIGMVAGGFGVGVALALLIELMFDPTVKRSLDLEKRLNVPLLLSIPYLRPSRRRRLVDSGNKGEAVADSRAELLRPFCEAIRDRLALFFEMNKLTRKPKLVAVTGLSKGAGVSTLAEGIAATLSDGGQGKVLLVDEQLSLKRFYEMIAEFKVSDFDYVIFDMPTLSDTSPTLAMAGFVDRVLVVIEAEKSDREIVRRSYAQLVAAEAKVSVIFNKRRSYAPKWIAN
jgi:polysaccharide biosynthesis transport protein